MRSTQRAVPAKGACPLFRSLGYDSHQGDPDEANFVKVTFPAATAALRLEYRWEITAIYPVLSERARPPVSRLSAELVEYPSRVLAVRLLSNNIVSDPCVICMYEYADIARHAPPLADGLTARRRGA